ncbi:MAG TPA: hypothetical protein VHV83_09280, partial [Armatimonadota bacterium]|nr:hypothetical protein [Armatimonadota bacterium]
NSIFSLANRWVVVRWRIHPLVASLIVQALSGVLAIATILILHVRWQPGASGEMIAVAVISMSAFTLMMISFEKDDASAVAPILGLKVIFLAIIESCTLGHAIGLGVPCGAVVSVVGVALSSQMDRWSLHPRDIWRPGVALMMLAALFLSICDLLVKRSLHAWQGDSLGISLYVVAMIGIISVVLLPVFMRSTEQSRIPVDEHASNDRPVMVCAFLLCAVMSFLMQYFIFGAFSHSCEVTIPNIIYNSRSLMVVALAALLVLGKKSTVEQARSRAYAYRTFGALATLGAIALALLMK